MNRIAVVGALLLTACASDPSATDAGTSFDAGGDAGPPWMEPDAGPPGAALVPARACDAVAEALYATPTSMPADRGALIGCAHVETVSEADLHARLAGVEGLVFAGGAAEVYLVAFRTERDSGDAAYSTALVVLPEIALAERVPMVLAMHGSVGVADVCAPSRHFLGTGTEWLPASYVDALVLAWAARGLPVIMPDYAGLGTDGTHAYASWIDGAVSGIDAARALRALLPPDRVDGVTLVYGHSQGGGLALSVGALARSAPDLDVRAVVAQAPAWRVISVLDALGLRSVALSSVTRAAVATSLYSELANVEPDAARWGDGFVSSLRDHVSEIVATECYDPARISLDEASAGYTPPATVGELVDEAFGAAVSACTGGGACDGVAGAIVARDRANEPHFAADAPPVLVVGSRGDEAATPGIVGCVVDRIRDDGVMPDVCMLTEVDHLGVVPSTARYAIDWALAAARGAPRPPCAAATTSPRCSLF